MKVDSGLIIRWPRADSRERRSASIARAVLTMVLAVTLATLLADPSWGVETAAVTGEAIAEAAAATAAATAEAAPQEAAEPTPEEVEAGTTFSVYGFAMLDMGYQTKQNDPDWFDVLRPTKLPAFEDQFGEDGHWFSGVRQSRLGVKSSTPTKYGDLKTQFEFELFGTGVDAGQTTLRLRHAYGELGQFGAGQTWSPFMDIDVFPNTVEYWGPNGMAFFRNVQVRWMPIKGDSFMTIALERPGASGDAGDFADRIEVQNLRGRFPAPDLSAEYRSGGHEWGYVEIAGIVRYIEMEDTLDDAFNLDDEKYGWGLNLSSNLKFGDDERPHVARLAAVYGEGVQNYMNDAPVDVGAHLTGDPSRPLEAEVLEMLGITAFIDFNWSEHASSAIGYSNLEIDNSNGQSADAFKYGEYAIANIMFYPVKNVMMGPELQWGRRENNSDGFDSEDFRIQFSAKYNFSHEWGGGN
jgi:DcaP outer membrane protein